MLKGRETSTWQFAYTERDLYGVPFDCIELTVTPATFEHATEEESLKHEDAAQVDAILKAISKPI